MLIGLTGLTGSCPPQNAFTTGVLKWLLRGKQSYTITVIWNEE